MFPSPYTSTLAQIDSSNWTTIHSSSCQVYLEQLLDDMTQAAFQFLTLMMNTKFNFSSGLGKFKEYDIYGLFVQPSVFCYQ